MSSLQIPERMSVFENHADMISIILSHHDEAFAEVDVHVLHPRHLRHRDGAGPGSGTEHDPDPGKGHNHDEGCNDDEAIPPQRGFENGRIGDGQRRLGRAPHGRPNFCLYSSHVCSRQF